MGESGEPSRGSDAGSVETDGGADSSATEKADDEPALSDEALDRLADVVNLQPTKNADLQERWGVESGSEVHTYLESELGEYYYRDDDSLIRATADGVALVGGDPSDATTSVSELEARVVEVLAGPDERAQSVVATLHNLREAFDVGADVDADTVRRALRSLARKGVVGVVHRTVPTFKLSRPREELSLDVTDDDADPPPAADDEMAAIEELQPDGETVGGPDAE